MKVLSLIGALVLSLTLTACGDKSGGRSTDTTTTPLGSQYYTINKGLCYDDANNRVDTSNCDGLMGYYEVNGYCYNPTNVRVGNDYCQQYPTRVRPSCHGNGFYGMKRGKRYAMECNNRGCHGRSVFDRDGRATFCRN